MWFDARAHLAEVLREHPDPAHIRYGVSQLSRVSQLPDLRPSASSPRRVASVAVVASGESPKTAIASALDDCRRTWTGRLVSEADWQTLTDWDRHGPNGRLWNGLTFQWETAGGDTDD